MEGSHGSRPHAKPCPCPSQCHHIHACPILPTRALSPPLSKRSSPSSATNSVSCTMKQTQVHQEKILIIPTSICTVLMIPRMHAGFCIPLGSSEPEYYDKRNLCARLWEEIEKMGWNARLSQPFSVHDPLLRLLLTKPEMIFTDNIVKSVKGLDNKDQRKRILDQNKRIFRKMTLMLC